MNKTDFIKLLHSLANILYDSKMDESLKNFYDLVDLLINYVIYKDGISELANEFYNLSIKLLNWKIDKSEKKQIINELKTRISKK